MTVYDLTTTKGWPLRQLKVAARGNPYVAVAEVERLAWLDRRLPVPKLLASAPLADGGHALVLALTTGTPATDPEHRFQPELLVDRLATALRFVHEIPVEGCPFSSRIDVRLRAVKRRLDAGLVDPEQLSPAYRRSGPKRLVDLLIERAPVEDDLVFCHGGFGLEAVRLDPSGVTGIVDWDRAGVADRCADLAQAVGSIATLIGPELIARFLSGYGLERPDARKLDYYALLAEFT